MLVGPSGSGKSAAWQCLLAALEAVEGVESCVHVIDPKALTKEELYGTLDPTTREWGDGVFTAILRRCAGRWLYSFGSGSLKNPGYATGGWIASSRGDCGITPEKLQRYHFDHFYGKRSISVKNWKRLLIFSFWKLPLRPSSSSAGSISCPPTVLPEVPVLGCLKRSRMPSDERCCQCQFFLT